jgi:hypothetical protein
VREHLEAVLAAQQPQQAPKSLMDEATETSEAEAASEENGTVEPPKGARQLAAFINDEPNEDRREAMREAFRDLLNSHEEERYALDKRVGRLESERHDLQTDLKETRNDARHWRNQASDATERRHQERMAAFERFKRPRVVVRDKHGRMTHVRNLEDGEVVGNAAIIAGRVFAVRCGG